MVAYICKSCKDNIKLPYSYIKKYTKKRYDILHTCKICKNEIKLDTIHYIDIFDNPKIKLFNDRIYDKMIMV